MVAAVGRASGPATSWPRSRSPAARWRRCPRWSAGRRTHGFDLVGSGHRHDRERRGSTTGGRVSRATSARRRQSSGLHSNGFTLARRPSSSAAACARQRAPELAHAGRGAARADGDLRARGARDARAEVAVRRACAHHRRRIPQLDTHRRRPSASGSTLPQPPPPIFGLIQEKGEVPEQEMWGVFNMGIGFCAWSRRPAPGRRSTCCAAAMQAPLRSAR